MKCVGAVTSSLLMAIVYASPLRADGILMSWSPRSLEGMTEQRWETAKKQSTQDVLKANRQVTTWPDAYLCLLGANQHKDEKTLLTGLTGQLTDQTERSLRDTSRLVIWERIVTGEILFEGEGFQVDDDLFTVAGRANWILRSITKKGFGYVKPKPSAESLQALQDKWNRWLRGEQVQEYSEPHPGAEKGLEEIRSLAAIQALVISLQPSSKKDQKTVECLRSVYHIDKLPAEPAAPGRLCSPDSWAYTYLGKVTDVREQHDPSWWSRWWAENKSNLVWDQGTGRFVIRGQDAKPKSDMNPTAGGGLAADRRPGSHAAA
jgi:hypothetical protein